MASYVRWKSLLPSDSTIYGTADEVLPSAIYCSGGDGAVVTVECYDGMPMVLRVNNTVYPVRPHKVMSTGTTVGTQVFGLYEPSEG